MLGTFRSGSQFRTVMVVVLIVILGGISTVVVFRVSPLGSLLGFSPSVANMEVGCLYADNQKLVRCESLGTSMRTMQYLVVDDPTPVIYQPSNRRLRYRAYDADTAMGVTGLVYYLMEPNPDYDRNSEGVTIIKSWSSAPKNALYVQQEIFPKYAQTKVQGELVEFIFPSAKLGQLVLVCEPGNSMQVLCLVQL